MSEVTNFGCVLEDFPFPTGRLMNSAVRRVVILEVGVVILCVENEGHFTFQQGGMVNRIVLLKHTIPTGLPTGGRPRISSNIKPVLNIDSM